MLLSGDVKSLEVVTCAYLSHDKVLSDEVREGKDFHTDNQRRFQLPDRVTAKRFKFKLIYGASAYGYANDADFLDVGYSQQKWQEIIDEYYDKYRGVKEWHNDLVRRALVDGNFVSPSGRVYKYPAQDVAKRTWYWRPKILNYPVQGLGADLVMLARISFWRRLCEANLQTRCLAISSVHDSIVVDIDNDPDLWYTIGVMLRKSVRDVPLNFKRMFNVDFDLPLDCEVKLGTTLGDMQSLEFAKE